MIKYQRHLYDQISRAFMYFILIIVPLAKVLNVESIDQSIFIYFQSF